MSAGVSMEFIALKACDIEEVCLDGEATSKDWEHGERKFWKGSVNWALGKKMKSLLVRLTR